MAKALAIVSPVIDPPATDTLTPSAAQPTTTNGLIVVFASLFLVLAAGLTLAPSRRLAAPLAPSMTGPGTRRRSGRARRSQR